MDTDRKPDDAPDDELGLLKDPEPEKPVPDKIEDEGEPGGENFV